MTSPHEALARELSVLAHEYEGVLRHPMAPQPGQPLPSIESVSLRIDRLTVLLTETCTSATNASNGQRWPSPDAVRVLSLTAAAVGQSLLHLTEGFAYLGLLHHHAAGGSPVGFAEQDRAVHEAAVHLQQADNWLAQAIRQLRGEVESLDGTETRAEAAQRRNPRHGRSPEGTDLVRPYVPPAPEPPPHRQR